MQPEKNRLWTKEFIILTLCNFLLFLQLHMIISTLPTYVQGEFKASSFQVSLFTTLFALSAIAARLYSAKQLEKGNRNKMIYLGIVIILLVTLGYYFAAVMGVLLVMRMIFGIGFGLSSTAFPTMATDVIPVKRMGEGMGYFGLSTSLAMSIGPVIGLAILNSLGFTVLTWATALVILIIAPLSYILTSKSPKSKEAFESPFTDETKKGFNKALIIPSVLNMLLAVTYGGIVSFIALFGKENGIDNAALFFLFNALAILIVRPFAGRIYDTKGHLALVIPGSILVIAGLVLLSNISSTAGLFVSAFLFGLGYGALQPSFQTWMIQVVSPAQRGLANGMFLNTLDFGIALGSLVLGVIATFTGYNLMFRYSALFVLLLLIIYLVHMSKARRTKMNETTSM
ncbi:MFS transporter [Paenibacillus gallinarum]|uniref:MFS transporter n=1 Tax=Paenibacillus gallinarum TaxID=2762232 RepID=A0ABR8SUF7_9BACL|nr:MFS transporter [Paenibacillus gallinarum]MBD7967127.1 MFS transporter [Paenibacillus gallinarum]